MSGTVSKGPIQMRIGEFDLKEKVLVVAEIGNNHEGNFNLAKDLVRKAAECGVNAVKFQTFKTEHYVSRSEVARFNQLKSFELSHSQFEELSRLTHSLDLLFISTPFDLVSAVFLETMVDAYKIASGDNNFYPLIGRVAQTGKPLIISTGSSDAGDVGKIVSFVRERLPGQDVSRKLAILHCVSSYPVALEQANLRSIQYLRESFDCAVGYSDHTMGVEASVMAVALGAQIIEKHFTLNKQFSNFRDHQLSADPDEMRELVQRIRIAESMLGVSMKIIQPCEESAIGTTRRSIVAGADLAQGHRIIWSDLTWIRPAGGLSPGEEHVLLGKVLKRSVRFGEQLRMSDVE